MPPIEPASRTKLDTCDPDLIRLVEYVAEHRDVRVIEGRRAKECQDDYFHKGLSKLQWPNGKHCSTPSKAVDLMEKPVNWNDRKRIVEFAHFVLDCAKTLGIKIRWGGDWDGDGDSKDEKFFDGPHFELVG
jgi:peptidoglycan L-alanyl-D-glutamate endopeptidase CwlK